MSGTIVYGIRLTADGKGLVRGFRQSETQIDKFSGSVSRASRGARQFSDETARLDRRLRTAEAATGYFRREIVALVGAFGIKRAIEGTIGSFAGFQQGMLNVASVAGSTAE